MIEDKSFNAFLKAKLEEDIVVPKVACGHAGHVTAWRAYLLAASLAIICGIFSWQFVVSRDLSSERATLQAIALLDDSESTASADTFADKLLAWQDAPFNDIAN